MHCQWCDVILNLVLGLILLYYMTLLLVTRTIFKLGKNTRLCRINKLNFYYSLIGILLRHILQLGIKAYCKKKIANTVLSQPRDAKSWLLGFVKALRNDFQSAKRTNGIRSRVLISIMIKFRSFPVLSLKYAI